MVNYDLGKIHSSTFTQITFKKNKKNEEVNVFRLKRIFIGVFIINNTIRGPSVMDIHATQTKTQVLKALMSLTRVP